MAASTSEGDEQEALRLKSLAESNFKVSKDLKSALKCAKRAQRLAPNLHGVSETVTALTVLRAAAKSPSPDWYGVLGAEPFAPASTIRKQYKKLALLLHPDKSPHVASDEAFKLVSEAFRLLSDRARKRDYDAKLRLRIQKDKEKVDEEEMETFWTECSTCRLLHQFERKYVGHNLVCPTCRKSFKAVEVVEDDNGSKEEEEEEEVHVKGRSGRLKVEEKVDDDEKLGDFVLRRKSKSVKRKVGTEKGGGSIRSEVLKNNVEDDGVRDGDSESEGDGGGSGEWGGGRLRSGVLRKRTPGEVLDRSKPKKVKAGEETMTLAEFQSEVKRKNQQKKMNLKTKEKEQDGNEKRSKQGEALGGSKNSKGLEVKKGRIMKKSVKLAIKEKKEASVKRNGLRLEKHRDSDSGEDNSGGSDSGEDNSGDSDYVEDNNSGIMAVVDSDFYDFDKDRTERSFKKGQVWALYDDDDGMPRNYALIDEVVSVNPFDVRISWLDPQNNGDEKMISCMKMGFHIPCGRFKVARKDSIDSVNIFSHVVDYDCAAREVYQVYPRKGSVWALHGKGTLDADGKSFAANGKRCYDIVVFLTSYSEINGLSMAYLEKVDGYKTVFKRQEMGSHAIRFVGKDDIWLVSHHIPARKLLCDGTPELLKDCWELDPASLPSDLLCIGGIDN